MNHINELYWVKTLFPKRHDGFIFDPWNGKYPTFRATRQEMIKMYIRIYKSQQLHKNKKLK